MDGAERRGSAPTRLVRTARSPLPGADEVLGSPVRGQRQVCGDSAAGDRDQRGVRTGSGHGEHVAHQRFVVVPVEGLVLEPLDRAEEVDSFSGS